MPLITQKIRKPQKPGDLRALQRKLWWTLLRAEELMDTPELSHDLRLRAINAMAQVGSVYLRLLEGSEIETRLAALEAEAARPAMRRVW